MSGEDRMPVGPRVEGVLQVGQVLSELERALPLALAEQRTAEFREHLTTLEGTELKKGTLKAYAVLFKRRIAAMRAALDKADGMKAKGK
jgi:hypothetical protein